MNVLLINGSPHEKGCTYTALSLIAGELNKAGIDTLGKSGQCGDCTCQQHCMRYSLDSSL